MLVVLVIGGLLSIAAPAIQRVMAHPVFGTLPTRIPASFLKHGNLP